MGTQVRGRRMWRWRHNPLRRRSDVIEAWVVLVTGLVMAVGGPVAGVAAGTAVDASLRQERADRHRVPAVLKEDAPVAQPAADGSATGQVRAIVRWTGPDGAVHTGTARVHDGSKAGTATEIWTDDRGRMVQRPPTPSRSPPARCSPGRPAAGVGAVSLAGRGVARWRLDRARTREWGRAWAEVGPRWSRHIR
ncbi:Rv1733c family protein [Streptomyces rapamycinicus]|uniref:Rv1733c family protein n=1 Tax=Streptomyces rapamycinicus TaxID=1226757 RepID=UPI0032D8C0D9